MEKLKKFLLPFLEADSRSLAAFRIFFGLALVVDWFDHWLAKRELYHGVWSLRDSAVPLTDQFRLSIFWAVTSTTAIDCLMLLLLGAAVAYLLGYRTRLAGLIVLIGQISFHNAAPVAVDAGVSITMFVLTWSLFLPLDLHWALDRGKEVLSPQTVRSLGVAALRLQVLWIYFSAAISKTGDTWTSGEALGYLMQFGRMATPFGLWLGTVSAPWLLRLMTYGSMAIEYGAPLLLLVPGWTRIGGIVLLYSLQVGIGATIYTGFQVVMAASLFVFWDTGVWQLLSKRFAAMAMPGAKSSKHRFVPSGVNECLVGVLLCLHLNIALHSYGLVKTYLVDHGPFSPFALRQRWDMFAPNVPVDEGWWVVYAVGPDGTKTDFATGLPLELKRPKKILDQYGRFRFKALEQATSVGAYASIKGNITVDSYREFVKTHPSLAIKEVHMAFVKIPLQPLGSAHAAAEPNLEVVWTYFAPQPETKQPDTSALQVH